MIPTSSVLMHHRQGRETDDADDPAGLPVGLFRRVLRACRGGIYHWVGSRLR